MNVAGKALEGKRICLVSSGHVGSNPRLVKEANALCEAGASVRVITLDTTRLPDVRARDEHVLRDIAWSHTAIEAKGFASRSARGLLRRVCARLFSIDVKTPPVALRGFNAFIPALTRAAEAVPADLYIGHSLPALVAAALAAHRHSSKLGFDAEDFHSGQLPDEASQALAKRLTRWVEQRYLPLCDYLTAASPGIANAYAKLCNVPRPTVVLNVFPRSEAPCNGSPRALVTPSLYWFSQTVGPGRGLDVVVEAIALSRCRPVLYLRGTIARGYREHLIALAARRGVENGVRFLPPAAPAEMARLASRYDAGVASEPGDNDNNLLALSNKLFTFLLGGIPVLASATSGQTEIARIVPDAVRLFSMQDASSLARAIDELLLAPDILARARKAAWEAGQQRFNWDVEKQVFLGVIASCLGPA